VPICICPAGFGGTNCQIPGGTTASTTSKTTTISTTSTTSTTTTAVNPLARCPPGNDYICRNGGQCYYDTVDLDISCQCQPTFSGPTCERRDFFCNTVTCQNGGTCFNRNDGTLNGFCSCPSTGTNVIISGQFCEVQSPCPANTFNPCNNLVNTGNQCVRISNNSYCFCTSRWTGVYCESPL
jgi:hypothetical protein